MPTSTPPIVLCLCGHDPSGGAGLHADIETILALGCRPASVLTALTHQDSRDAYAVEPCPSEALDERLRLLLEDLPIAAVKIGLLGEPAQAEAIAAHLHERELPLVLDPVLVAGGGGVLAQDPVREALLQHLLPLADVVTPNAAEAQALCAGDESPDVWGPALLQQGATRVLITGADTGTGESETVVNRLYAADAEPQSFDWPRLPHRYHGSGCTLSSAIAALLAKGESIPIAIEQAQDYTWQCLAHGYQPGRGQHYPNRLYFGRGWLDEG